MRYAPEHKQKTRERVLKAAAQAVRTSGPQRVGVASVMGKAGLTHGGFYAHFESKDALVSAAIETMFGQMQAQWEKTTHGKPPADALRAFIDFYLSVEHRDAKGRGCAMAALASDIARLSATCKASFSVGVRMLQEGIASRLVALGHADAYALASSVLSELVGALTLARGQPDRETADAVLFASRAQIIRRLGLERRP